LRSRCFSFRGGLHLAREGVIRFARGAGKTTFYEGKLKVVFPTILKASSSPLEQAEIDRERRRLLKERQSFVYQHVAPDLGVIRDARAAGFDVKVIYIGTEDPNLNIGHILIRVSHGGAFAPLASVASDFEQGLKRLPQISKQVDDLIVFDNSKWQGRQSGRALSKQ
jgi:hypothetical protein